MMSAKRIAEIRSSLAAQESNPDGYDMTYLIEVAPQDIADLLAALEAVEGERDAAVDLLWRMGYYGSYHVGRNHDGGFQDCENEICAMSRSAIEALGAQK